MALTLALPPSVAADAPAEVSSPGSRIVIVGANGSGKTRFAEKIISSMPEGVTFRMSALQALYAGRGRDMLPGSIDSLYFSEMEQSPFKVDEGGTRFERLTSLIVYDELITLLEHKMHSPGEPLPSTKLDRMVKAWEEIFPDNKILRQSGRLIFSRGDDGAYSPGRLSDGEKAVLYCFGAVQFAPEGAVVFVDSPGMFLHPSIMGMVWARVEALRPDCKWVYITHDLDFLSQLGAAEGTRVVWVRNYDAAAEAWDYVVMPGGAGELSDQMCMTIVGARKPVLFIEGDGKNSIDAKLYPLIFRDYTVRSLGSCNKVIEATRSFNDLKVLHHLDSSGIVDRDRRDAHEVAYLRRRNILVPEVAEIENILMLEPVIRAVAAAHGRNPDHVAAAVKRSVVGQFRQDIRPQALQHTRHRIKRLMECKVDGRFTDITSFEEHIRHLADELQPRQLYEAFCREFREYARTADYPSVLRVYNKKSMVPASNVASLCGLKSKDDYINEIIRILRNGRPGAEQIRSAVRRCFGIENT